MPKGGQEALARRCPITDGACSCQDGPHEETISCEINGQKSQAVIKVCGELPVKQTTVQERVLKELKKNSFDD